MAREVVDKNPHGRQQSSAMRQQRSEGGLTGQPSRQYSRQLAAVQLTFADIGGKGHDSYSLGGRPLESGHVITYQSGPQRQNGLASAVLSAQAPGRRGVRSPHEKGRELLQVFSHPG